MGKTLLLQTKISSSLRIITTIIDQNVRCSNYSPTTSCNVLFWLLHWLVPCVRRSVSSLFYEGWRLWEQGRHMRRLRESRSVISWAGRRYSWPCSLTLPLFG